MESFFAFIILVLMAYGIFVFTYTLYQLSMIVHVATSRKPILFKFKNNKRPAIFINLIICLVSSIFAIFLLYTFDMRDAGLIVFIFLYSHLAVNAAHACSCVAMLKKHKKI